MAITDIIEESEVIDTGAPSIKYEGDRPLKKQEMLMAGPDWYIKRIEHLMYNFDLDYEEAGEIAYDSEKYYEYIGHDPYESRNTDQEEIVEEGIMRAANGGITPQLVRRNQDGSRPGYRGGAAYDRDEKTGKSTASKDTRTSGPTHTQRNQPKERGNPWESTGQTQKEQRQIKSNVENLQKQMRDTGGGAQDYVDVHADPSKLSQIQEGPTTTSGGVGETTTKVLDFIHPYNRFPNNSMHEYNYVQKLVNTYGENTIRKFAPELLGILDYYDEDAKPGFLSGDAAKYKKIPLETFNTLKQFNPSEVFNWSPQEMMIRGIDPTKVTGNTFEESLASGALSKSGIGNFNLISGGNLGNLKDLKNPGDLVNPATGKFFTDFEWDQHKRRSGQGASSYDRGPSREKAIEDRAAEDPCKGPNPPAYCFTGGKKKDEEAEEEDWWMPLAFRAEGGRVPAAYGGIMGDDGRRAYGLGSIFKKVKKIFKSPLGKAALLGLGGYKMGLFGGGKNFKLTEMIMGKGGKGGLWNWAKKNPFAAISGVSALTGLMANRNYKKYDDWGDNDDSGLGDLDQYRYYYNQPLSQRADGGRIGAQEGGLMDMGGMEKDYRQDGGFVPIGGKEKADDVPARLSKNEFVFTADAVRGAGGGDIDKGSEVMYNVMKNLEAGGDVSEETQGLDGAREMFQTSQRLEEVL